MKKYFILLLFFFLALQRSEIVFGGVHVEGGGDYLKILFREGKERALWALKMVSPEMLSEVEEDLDKIELYIKYRKMLAQDLKTIPSFIFCGEEEREQFLKPEGEKTALTTHESAAPIKINLKRCDELNITLAGVQVLLWREAGRHIIERQEFESDEELMIRIEPILDALEDIAVKAVSIHDSLFPPDPFIQKP
ncbi:MAG: hypothetical protein A2Z91_08025 [Deltaproteobacteria bacterium GWA2_38_16]|nr:MAG: hypothetical protein A2Z91_08025 [Deltaproteobacteria bacterium GWA2_38_16]OGQ02795.1 MAG: hypothetical protein A3D19_01350 [Deltaproteobacteria bacterium RIFCSPHIGHO2_02_FULL_38_15]OGQ59265.1 MAG: hypothetical protein A3G92_01450 [Deltaproteobacteria bacterium RIFCSPLOWO2_12_FULL_38_8]HBQ20537.1 hypothetical protein [Deltaproteobacteria bacterium]